MAYMPPSPKGRTIEHVEGSPSEIIARGSAIESLGDQMLDSATTLENIATQAIEDGTQKGKAIEALREAIGESYTVLREAGELYQPVGPVIRTYGEGLESSQPQIDYNADRCDELWAQYQALPGDVEPRGTGGLFEPEADSPEATAQAEEDQAKKAAYDAWEDQAGSFDFWYDSWESVYDHAVESIGDEMAGSIKDGFWEFLDDLGEVLSWAAFAVGILALVIGGPFVAIALALAAVVLVITLIQKAGGKKGWGDVAMAALGVFPVGKISNLTKLLHGTRGFKAFFKGANLGKGSFQALLKPGGGLVGIYRTKGPAAMFNQLLTGTTSFKTVYRDTKRIWQGQHTAAIRNGTAVRNLAGIDYGLGILGNAAGHYGRADTASGNNLPNLPGWVGAVL